MNSFFWPSVMCEVGVEIDLDESLIPSWLVQSGKMAELVQGVRLRFTLTPFPDLRKEA